MPGSSISTCQCRIGYVKEQTGNGFVRQCVRESIDSFEVIIERLEKNLTSSSSSSSAINNRNNINSNVAVITERPQNFMDDFAVNRGPNSCKDRVKTDRPLSKKQKKHFNFNTSVFQMIVVEKNEWIPELNYTMKTDNLTGARIATFFAR